MKKVRMLVVGGAMATALMASSMASAQEQPSEGNSGSEGTALMILTPIIVNNFQAAGRESGEGAKLVRAVMGISVRDIEKYGLWGGPNSIFRKPFG
jgi:hypothetical protein